MTGSRDFIRAYFPKIIFLSGSPAYKSNGSIILGTAEGGKKITLFNVDALQIASIDASTNYFKTIHHEFGHILNQTKPYTTDFKGDHRNALCGRFLLGYLQDGRLGTPGRADQPLCRLQKIRKTSSN